MNYCPTSATRRDCTQNVNNYSHPQRRTVRITVMKCQIRNNTVNLHQLCPKRRSNRNPPLKTVRSQPRIRPTATPRHGLTARRLRVTIAEVVNIFLVTVRDLYVIMMWIWSTPPKKVLRSRVQIRNVIGNGCIPSIGELRRFSRHPSHEKSFHQDRSVEWYSSEGNNWHGQHKYPESRISRAFGR